MTRDWIVAAAVGAVAAALAALVPGAALSVRLVAVLIATVPVGAVLMLAIAALTGARWQALGDFVRLLPLAAVLMTVALLAAPVTPDAPLGLWQHPIAAALRTAAFFTGLMVAAPRLERGGTTPAAVTLALYAAVATPIATDWLTALPSHPVSAVGMMLAVQQIAGVAAVALLIEVFGEAEARDLAKLLVAAMLGIGYLGYVDYLVVWYGNLPDRVPFYVVRTGGPTGMVAGVALLIGIGGPIAGLTLLSGTRGRRVAGGSAALAIAMFDGWWIGVPLLGVVAMAIAITAAVLTVRRAEILRHG